ncbi:MAG: hypothetical protein B2I18_07635 [Cuniculiplasma sp. C_DKE]|nr:MAG: hypothetical protein B2I18_07635 [Cuniculiplasma sp. C_DKE]
MHISIQYKIVDERYIKTIRLFLNYINAITGNLMVNLTKINVEGLILTQFIKLVTLIKKLIIYNHIHRRGLVV